MKLEYLDATGKGAFPEASPAFLIRLSEFTDEEKRLLIEDIQHVVLDKKEPLQLHKLSYIQSIDCMVSLELSVKDECLVPKDEANSFVCKLTPESFTEMTEIIRCVGDGHNWLTPGEYLDEPAFLISKWGPW